MSTRPSVLVAPDAFGADLRAPVVAAAIARGLERAGVAPPPELCPVAGGGLGTIEVLLPVLGGKTADGFALIEGGGTAIVERASTAEITGERIAAAAGAGAAVVLVAAGGPAPEFDGAAGVVDAIEQGGGLRGTALVVLCELRAAWTQVAGNLPRDPRGIPMTAAGGGLAGVLWSHYDARLLAGAPFVLQELGFDRRLRAARAVIVGEARLDRPTLEGRVTGEIATRARQAGVPCHAVVGANAIDRFDARILDLQAILVASTHEAIESAGEALTAYL
jgi:glycerate 2-kinase